MRNVLLCCSIRHHTTMAQHLFPSALSIPERYSPTSSKWKRLEPTSTMATSECSEQEASSVLSLCLYHLTRRSHSRTMASKASSSAIGGTSLCMSKSLDSTPFLSDLWASLRYVLILNRLHHLKRSYILCCIISSSHKFRADRQES